MAQLDGQLIKKLRRGERLGGVALGVCALALIGFVVCFTLAQTFDLDALRTACLIAAPVIAAAAVSLAALCNLKYGGALEREIARYVREVFVENAALMHPERDSLTFTVATEGTQALVSVNGYKEKIVFDFSAFGKLSPFKRLAVVNAVERRLSHTFCRLVVERGAKYSSVGYIERTGSKKSKAVPIITDGAPDKRAMKSYLKGA